MWIKGFLAILLVLQCHAELEDKHRDLSDSNTDFGLNLLHLAQTQKPGNTFLSPFSISSALALTYLGAEGKTREQMAAGLGFDKHDNPLELYKNISDHLFSKNAPFTLRQGNRLFADHSLPILDSYLKEAAEYFDAGLKRVDFSLDKTRIDINEWIEDKTEDRIKDMLKEGDMEGAVLMLVNAIYFKAVWSNAFSEHATRKDQDFKITEDKKVKVDNMVENARFRVGKIPGVTARMLELNYTGNDASMYVILPDEGKGLCVVQAALSADKMNKAIKKLEPKHIKVTMPKFEINYNIQLVPILRSLGMNLMFTNSADFSRLTPDPTKVSSVKHQAFVRVDENGTEAAAATVVSVVRTSLPIVEDEFIIDRPFIFVIRERESQAVLFMARVVDPTDKATFANDNEGHKCDIKVEKLVTVSDQQGSGHQITPLFLLHVLIFAALAMLF